MPNNTATEFLELQKRLDVYRVCGPSVVRYKHDKKARYHDRDMVNRYQRWFTDGREFRAAIGTINGLLKLRVRKD